MSAFESGIKYVLMLIGLVGLLHLATSCGFQGDPCVVATASVDNLCIKEGMNKIVPELMSQTIAHTQHALALRGVEVDLPQMFLDYNVGLWIEPIDSEGLEDDTLGFQDNNLLVSEDWPIAVYSTTNHEILHFVAEYVMGVSYEENFNHSTPNLFMENAEFDGVNEWLTVEGISKKRINKDVGEYLNEQKSKFEYRN